MPEDRIVAAAKAWIGYDDDALWEKLDENFRKHCIVRAARALEVSDALDPQLSDEGITGRRALFLELWQLLGYAPGSFETSMQRLGWDGMWDAILEAFRTQLNDAHEEIGRHHADFERWETMAARGAGQADRVAELEQALRELIDAQFQADRSLDLARGKARETLGSE